MPQPVSRRRWLAATTSTTAVAAAWRPARTPASPSLPSGTAPIPCRLSFNTSTIRGQRLPLDQEIDLVADAGFDCIEPWVDELQRCKESGPPLSDIARRIADRGLTVESAIGFFDWAVDEPERRKQALEAGRRAMELVKQVDGKRLACPPAGITDRSDVPHEVLAERFRAVVAIGREVGVVPQLEVWGFSQSITTLADAAAIALMAGESDAAILADVYHLYKGGSAFETVGMMSRRAFQVFHVNDYPDIPPAEIKDEHRVYPGDGVAPLALVLRQLWDSRFDGVLSLELFNRDYWAQDPRVVVETGYTKLRQAVEASLAGAGNPDA